MDFFLLASIIFVALFLIGLILNIKSKKASMESSFVLPFLGLCFVTAFSFAFTAGFVEYIVNLYTSYDGLLFGIGQEELKYPALFGALGFNSLAIIGFFKFCTITKQKNGDRSED